VEFDVVTAACDVPVVLFLFNRPETLAICASGAPAEPLNDLLCALRRAAAFTPAVLPQSGGAGVCMEID
jgi:hypothetical protein